MFTFNLNEQKYVFDQNKMIIAKKDEYEKEEMDKSPNIEQKKKYFSNVNFIMNNCCNMACSYCYANKGKYDVSGIVLEFDTARKVIDSLEKTRKEENGAGFNVTFFGGEPLLQFKLIKQIVDYAYTVIENDVVINWSIVTNGTLLNDEIVDFFCQHEFVVTISIDGEKRIHDATRKFADGKGTYDLIANNIRRYREKMHIVARITINESNTDVLRAVKDIKGLGVKRIVICVDNNMSDDSFAEFCKSVSDLFEDYKQSIIMKDYYIIDNINRYIIKLALRKKTKYHCSSGISYFAISADKKAYLCHRFVGIEDAYVTDVDDNFEKNIKETSEKNMALFDVDNRKNVGHCKKCSLINLCGGICYHDAYCKGGSIDSRNDRACILKRLYMTLTMQLLVGLPEEERKNYLLYQLSMTKEKW